MAMASLFLAAKIEEDCRKIRDVVNVFHHLSQKRTGRYVLNVLCCYVWYFYTASVPCVVHELCPPNYWLCEMPV